MENEIDRPRRPVSPETGEGLDESHLALFQANLDLFKRTQPAAAAKLDAIHHPHSRLVRIGDDDWDIEFGGIALYGIGCRAVSEQQSAIDYPGRTRIFMSDPSGNCYDTFTNAYHDRLTAAIAAEGLSVSHDFVDDDSFHVICMGVGLGFHLPGILDRTRCGNLILLEVNLEFLFHSLYVFDWGQVLDPERRPGLRVTLMLQADSVATPITIREALRCGNPTLVDGTLLHLHYPNNDYQAVFAGLMKDINLTLSGLGFISDEFRMVRNSYQCLKTMRSRLFQTLPSRSDWPVIVVGSGPSLDRTIDDLKRNADQALIISCGTALPALLRHGVRPDFFAILENTPEIYDYVKRTADEWGLDGITLIGSSTIDPRLPALFDSSILFMRAGLASYPLFCRDQSSSMTWGQPTVTNTGLAAALGLGFRTVYLFGVDLGSREPERHHSALSPYHADGMEYDGVMDKPVPGNFGGQVYADHVFSWSRDVFEQTIYAYRIGLRVINCSDGVFIRGTTPKLSHTLTLPPAPEDKAEALKAILDKLPVYDEEMFRASWSLERLTEEQNTLRRALKTALEDAKDGRDILIRLIQLILFAFARPAHHFIRGTLMQMMIVSSYYILRTKAEDRPAMTALICRLLGDEVDTLSDLVCTFLADIDGGAVAGPWLFDQYGNPAEI